MGKEDQQSKKRKAKELPSVDFGHMSVDDFLNGGFEAAAAQDTHLKHSKGKAKLGSAKKTGSTKKRRELQSIETKNASDVGLEVLGSEDGSAALSTAPAANPQMQQKKRRKVSQTSGDSKRGKKASESEEHKSQLAALKENDPEFYKYLLETDKELLEFQTAESESDEDQDIEVAEDEALEAQDEDILDNVTQVKAAEEALSSKKSQKQGILSQALVERWCNDAKEKNSMAAFDRLMKAYRIACHLGDQEESLDATMRITSSTVFNKILLFMIKEAGPMLWQRLGISEEQQSVKAVRKSPRWRKLESPIKSFMGNSLHLMTEMTDEAMVVFLLRHLRPCIPFLTSSDRLQRKYLKQVLQLFGDGKTRVRVQAVLFLRQMAIALPPPFLSLAMKGAYRTFVVNAKFMSPANLPHINFMASCVVEIFGLDSAAAYEHAFGYLRQLAILVKNAQSQKSKEAFREVYCWQTVNSLELWAKLLSTHADKEELRPLIYPIAQLLMAAVRLVPTARYFPLRLRLVKALNKLAQACNTFIPVAPLLLEALQWSGLTKPAKPGGKPPSEAVPQLRAGKQMLETVAYQQALVEEVFLLLAEHLAQSSTSVSFPEYANTLVLQIQQVAKTSKVEKFRSGAKGLVAAVRVNAEYVLKHRRQLNCSPGQGATIATFLALPSDAAKAPMAVYAGVLAEKAARKRAMQSTAEISLDDGKDAESETDEDEMPNQELLPELKKKSAAKKANAASALKQAEQNQAALASIADDEDLDLEVEDDVREFHLSDSDNESGEEE